MAALANIYCVTNTVNQKQYIGVTRYSAGERWKRHCYNASRGVRTRLYSAIRKYGAQSFTVTSVASCLSEPSSVEKIVIQSFAPEYNQTNGGEITIGRRVAPDVIEKIRRANTGKKRTEAQREAISAIKREQYTSRPDLKEAAVAQLAIASAKIDRQKQKAAASKSSRERIWTDASREKLSKSCLGRRYGAEILEKIAATKRKRVLCLETGEQFPSILAASDALSISNSNIGKVCDGKRRTAGGHTFKYVGG